MLEHLHAKAVKPERTVILGAGGFVGSAVQRRLEADGCRTVPLGRPATDLLLPGAGMDLAARLIPSDALIVISASAPCKSPGQLVTNVRMAEAVCDALSRQPVAHVVYISSDAVYADSDCPLTERSCAAPDSLHGAMHLAREVMLKAVVGVTPIAILRPSLLYGANDPHNGYGPNQFRRLAAQGKPIVLFGQGEERRDHVFIDDVAELIRLVVVHRSRGVLNAATGAVSSFREIAEAVAAQFDPRPAITTRPRTGPMPHNGFRPFDPGACRIAFPSFQYTPLAAGLARVREQTKGDPHA